MGQHNTNPTAIAAAKGTLPPRPQKMTPVKLEREIYKAIYRAHIRSMIRG